MEHDIFFVRDKVVQGKLKVLHIPSEFQLANLLTKPLSSTRFLNLKSKLAFLTILVNTAEFEGGMLGNPSEAV